MNPSCHVTKLTLLHRSLPSSAGQYGEGALLKKGKAGAYYKTTGASFGMQAGGQTYGYAMFFVSAKALDQLDNANGFEVGVGPSVVLVDEGMAKTITTTTLKDDIYALPAGDPDRNLTHLRESLLDRAPLPPDHIYAMPVEEADIEIAARRYPHILEAIVGTPPVLDLAHLGLGPDGHMASLVPGDPVVEVADRDVAVTGVDMRRRRMTLTYPILNRSRRVLWVLTGAEKAMMSPRLRAADASIPAGRVRQEQALVHRRPRGGRRAGVWRVASRELLS